VTPGVGITAAPCAQPLSTTAAVIRAKIFRIISARCSSRKTLITGTR
jgi:hypothetical protein